MEAPAPTACTEQPRTPQQRLKCLTSWGGDGYTLNIDESPPMALLRYGKDNYRKNFLFLRTVTGQWVAVRLAALSVRSLHLQCLNLSNMALPAPWRLFSKQEALLGGGVGRAVPSWAPTYCSYFRLFV